MSVQTRLQHTTFLIMCAWSLPTIAYQCHLCIGATSFFFIQAQMLWIFRFPYIWSCKLFEKTCFFFMWHVLRAACWISFRSKLSCKFNKSIRLVTVILTQSAARIAWLLHKQVGDSFVCGNGKKILHDTSKLMVTSYIKHAEIHILHA